MASDLTQDPWANDPSPVQKRLCDPGLPRGRSDILALAFATPEVLWTVEEGGRFCIWNASHWGISPESPFPSLAPTRAGPDSVSPSRPDRPQCVNLDDPGMLWVLEPDWNMGFAASGELGAYELPSGKQLWSRECNSWITGLATGPGPIPGRPGIILTGHDDGSLFLWDLSGPKRTIKRIFLDLAGPVAALAISADGTRFAVAAADRTIVLFGRDGSASTLSMPEEASSHKGPITSLCWGGEKGDTLFSASWDQTVRVWDVTEAKPRILLNSHMGHVTAMAWVEQASVGPPTEIQFLSADDSGHLHSWEADHWNLLGVPRELDDPVRVMALSPDRRLFAWADSARRIHMVPMGELAGDTRAPFPDSIDPRSLRDDLFLDPHSGQLFHRSADGRVRLWHIQGGNGETGPTPISSAIVCHPDGQWIWLAECDTPPGIHGMGEQGDSEALPTKSAYGVGRVLGFHRIMGSQWRLESVIETSLGGITTLALSDDGQELAIGSHLGPEVEIRKLPGGEPIAFWGSEWPGETVQAITAQKDGWVVGTLDPMATGGTHGNTWLLDREGVNPGDGVPARILAHHAPTGIIARIDHLSRLGIYRNGAFFLPPESIGPWQAMAFSPDGRYLALGGEQKISLYDLSRGKWVGSVETVSGVRAIIIDGGPSAIWAAFRCGECCLFSMSNWIESHAGDIGGLEP